MFQVRVGVRSGRVVNGDQIGGYTGRKSRAPHHGIFVGRKIDSSDSVSAGVSGTHHDWPVRDYLSESSGPLLEVTEQLFEGT